MGKPFFDGEIYWEAPHRGPPVRRFLIYRKKRIAVIRTDDILSSRYIFPLLSALQSPPHTLSPDGDAIEHALEDRALPDGVADAAEVAALERAPGALAGGEGRRRGLPTHEMLVRQHPPPLPQPARSRYASPRSSDGHRPAPTLPPPYSGPRILD
jgi:hypothetical protein